MPQLLWRRAVVGVAGGSDDARSAAPAEATCSVDLRFGDGHLERWLGVSAFDGEPVAYGDLVAWGTEVAQEHSMSGDLRMEFASLHRQALDDAPIETLVAWNATLS